MLDTQKQPMALPVRQQALFGPMLVFWYLGSWENIISKMALIFY